MLCFVTFNHLSLSVLHIDTLNDMPYSLACLGMIVHLQTLFYHSEYPVSNISLCFM